MKASSEITTFAQRLYHDEESCDDRYYEVGLETCMANVLLGAFSNNLGITSELLKVVLRPNTVFVSITAFFNYPL